MQYLLFLCSLLSAVVLCFGDTHQPAQFASRYFKRITRKPTLIGYAAILLFILTFGLACVIERTQSKDKDRQFVMLNDILRATARSEVSPPKKRAASSKLNDPIITIDQNEYLGKTVVLSFSSDGKSSVATVEDEVRVTGKVRDKILKNGILFWYNHETKEIDFGLTPFGLY